MDAFEPASTASAASLGSTIFNNIAITAFSTTTATSDTTATAM